MDNETAWGRAEVVDLASERVRRQFAPLLEVERWAEDVAEQVGPDPAAVARGRAAGGPTLPLVLARIEGSQSAYTEVAARMAAYQRLDDPRDVEAVLAGEQAWCETELGAARMAAELSDGEEQFHALGRAEGLYAAALRLGGVLEDRRSVSRSRDAASVLAWRSRP